MIYIFDSHPHRRLLYGAALLRDGHAVRLFADISEVAARGTEADAILVSVSEEEGDRKALYAKLFSSYRGGAYVLVDAGAYDHTHLAPLQIVQYMVRSETTLEDIKTVVRAYR